MSCLGINKVYVVLGLQNKNHVEGGKREEGREGWLQGEGEITYRIWLNSTSTWLSNRYILGAEDSYAHLRFWSYGQPGHYCPRGRWAGWTENTHWSQPHALVPPSRCYGDPESVLHLLGAASPGRRKIKWPDIDFKNRVQWHLCGSNFLCTVPDKIILNKYKTALNDNVQSSLSEIL